MRAGYIAGMVLEAHGTLPVTLDKDVEMFYPTPAVDAAGRMGISFSAASKVPVSAPVSLPSTCCKRGAVYPLHLS